MPGFKCIPSHPEFGATPDLVLEINHKRYVILFHDVTKYATSVDDTISDIASQRERIYESEDGEYILRSPSIYVEVAALFAAYPDAGRCLIVFFGYGDDIAISKLQRGSTILKKRPLNPILNDLRMFYIRAILPELAYSRQQLGHKLRDKLASDNIATQVLQSIEQ